jgi:hypothetical protein
MKTIFAGPQGIRAGWRFAIFLFLLFGFSKPFFWLLTVLFHYQEHARWFPTDFLLDGALSFGAALLAAWFMSRIERRAFHEYGLYWNTKFGKQFCQGVLWGFGGNWNQQRGHFHGKRVFWAKWITSGLLTRDQSEVDSDLTDPRPFPALIPGTDACQFGTPTLILTRGLP